MVAWSDGAAGHIVDYGRLEVPSEDLGVERATLTMLREFRDMCQGGWPVGHADQAEEDVMSPHAVWIDAGYMTDVVYAFTRESGDRFLPISPRWMSKSLGLSLPYVNQSIAKGSSRFLPQPGISAQNSRNL